MHLFSSIGDPAMVSVGEDLDGPWESQKVDVSLQRHFPLWIESAWRDPNGTLFAWYHHEPSGLCGGNGLSAPKIGAVVSYDGGQTVIDLGIVLESGDPIDCNAQNGYFAGGHGDFSVILDKEGKHFYFFFTNYAGDASSQGIVTARLAFEDRFNPAGNVYKYYRGEWDQPGIGGKMTPVFPVITAWQREDTDSFWGPAVHWNTFLQQYVMLLNHTCCEKGWPQEGIWISYASDLHDPASWRQASALLRDAETPGGLPYYPQFVGLGPGETDSLIGERARLFVQGVSTWEVVFVQSGPGDSPNPDKDPPPTSLPIYHED